ncbi:MAG: AMP-binding protein, partial [Bryobacteraceae bacterium]
AGWISRTHIELGLVPIGALLLGFFSIAMAASHSYVAAMCWLVAIGFSGGLFFVPLNAFLQERAGVQEKGRLMATNNFVNMLGILLASVTLWLLHDQLHWRAAAVIAGLGVVTVIATVYIVSVLPGEVLRLFLFGLSRLVFRIRIFGADRLPASGGALLISNHASYADAALIGGCTHRFVRFLMWKPYFEVKLAKPLLTVLQAIPINPGSVKEMLKSLRKAADELKQGELVCIFPEGGLTRTGHVQAFQRGVERLMQYSPETPVIPIYLDGLWRHPLSANGPRSFRNWFGAWRREIRILIGDPTSGPITAAELRLRVLELGTQAVNLRKKPDSTLAHALVRSARRSWSRPALADSTKKRLSYGQTLTAAVLLSNWLRANHESEQNVGILLPASVGGAITNFGVALSGKTAVNLNFTAGEPNCRAAIHQCGIRTVIASKAFLAKADLPAWPEMVYLEDLLAGFNRAEKFRALVSARFSTVARLAGRSAPDDIASILFSSGSTGNPKGIELTHWNILANIEAAATVFPMRPEDCMLGVLPFFHSFGYTFGLWFPMAQQFRAVFHPNPTDAKVIGELALAHHATFFLSTPTFCGHYIRKCTREQFSSLRFVLVGAEKLRDSVAEEFRAKFEVNLSAGYGATELGPCATVNTPDMPSGDGVQLGTRAGSVGRTLPGVSVRIVHPETFEPLPPGKQGLLLVASPSRMAGYHGAPAKTEEVLRDGFYVTGDLGYLNEDGFVYLTDRLARFSKIAGEMVPHLKIEDAAHGILADSPCFVTGIPDDRRGERLVMLYTQPRITPAQIVEHLNASGLPPLWIPKRDNVYLVDAIPVLGTGKADLAKARAMSMERVQSQPSTAVEAIAEA